MNIGAPTENPLIEIIPAEEPVPTTAPERAPARPTRDPDPVPEREPAITP